MEYAARRGAAGNSKAAPPRINTGPDTSQRTYLSLPTGRFISVDDVSYNAIELTQEAEGGQGVGVTTAGVLRCDL